MTNPLGRTAEARTYGLNGPLVTLPDANANVTTMDYDGFDRPDAIHYADGTGLESTESFAYDAAGNVTTRTTRAGDDIVFTYDGPNRLLTKTPPSPAPVVTYRYDLNGRLIGVNDNRAAIAAISGAAGNERDRGLFIPIYESMA